VPAIARAIGVRDGGDRPLLDGVTAVLRRGCPLLLLDNFEHVVEMAPMVADLLAACPQLTVLATSRAPLHVPGEQEFLVSPLSFPASIDAHDAHKPATLKTYDAVALFEVRARATRPEFRIDGTNAAAVAEICRRLEGLPLAIEMAAARTKVLPPRALAERLGNRLDLLALAAQNHAVRYPTLRAALDWSYSLLRPDEQRLLGRLAVFAGGCTLEAADAVCAPGGAAGGSAVDVLAGIEALVDQSLVQAEEQPEGRPRFRLLETIRAYALERLTQSGEEETVRGRFAAYFADLADAAEKEIHGPDQVAWLVRLDAEVGNLRGALDQARASGDAEFQMRLAGALWDYWWARGTIGEALWWLKSAVIAGKESPGEVRARALQGAGQAAALCAEFDQAAAFFRESEALWRMLGDTAGLAKSLSYQASLPWIQRDHMDARRVLQEALPLWKQLGDGWGIGYTLHALGLVAWTSGDNVEAEKQLQEALTHWRRVGEVRGIAFATVELSFVALSRGEAVPAETLARESLAMFDGWQDHLGYVLTLISLAGGGLARGDADRAARLIGAADALCELTGTRLVPGLQQARGGVEAGARVLLGDTGFETALTEGRSMPLPKAVEYALGA
jgi:non-specific serine/threonine protein kinase